MGKLRLTKLACIVFAFCGAAVIASHAQTLTTLHSFAGYPTDGANPWAGLVQATDGNLYGTTAAGGVNNDGTVFEITAGGTLTMLYSFCFQPSCTDGGFPAAGLVQATNGKFYGTTGDGGTYGDGTVFEITAGGKLTTLYSFCSQTNCTDGAIPIDELIQATDGNFYGTTTYGGTNYGGTVFEITAGGKLSTLYRFCSQPNCTDGSYPWAGLVQATDGRFYGTTSEGGVNGTAYGTVFEVTPTGTLTTLYSFCSQPNCADGYGPSAGLIQATDGNFYGTTSYGGAKGVGSVFKITAGGTLTTLYSFCSQPNCADGSYPQAGLVQATDGNFYGTTYQGGSGTACTYRGEVIGCGTIFSLAVGLGPFVETLPTSGKVGKTVKILGNNLTGTTSVSFNGTAATFTVVSSSEIVTTVPAGATTGRVTVVTPAGTLNSNVVFLVTPQISGFTPTSGPVGTVVTITGAGLTQTSAVTFGGAKATQFTIISDTEVQATVPTRARTGHIATLTPAGTAMSSSTFTVTE